MSVNAYIQIFGVYLTAGLFVVALVLGDTDWMFDFVSYGLFHIIPYTALSKLGWPGVPHAVQNLHAR